MKLLEIKKYKSYKIGFIIIFYAGFTSNLQAQDINNNKYNIQSQTTINLTKGNAFGEETKRQIINNLSEIPLSKNSSIGENIQFSHVTSTYNNGSQAYSFNGLELFYRYRFLTTKYLGLTIHNSYRFHGIYNENKYLSLMPKQNDYELRMIMAHNMSDRLINNIIKSPNQYFVRFELAYRKKFNNPFDEIRERFIVGINLGKNFSTLIQQDLIYAMTRNSSNTRNSFRQLQNFDFSKDFHHIISPSLIYKQNDKLAWQFGFFYRIGGNDNQYDSKGINVGILNSF